MLRLALSQLREQPRRYVAVLLAITIGVMFLTASFLVGSTTNATLRNTLAADFATADLVILPDEGIVDPGTVADVTAVDGVAEAFAHTTTSVALTRPGWLAGQGTWSEKADFATLANLPETPALIPEELLSGALPAGPDEVTLDSRTAAKYGVTPGSTLSIWVPWADGGEESPMEVTVTGILEASADPSQALAVQMRGTNEFLKQFSQWTLSDFILVSVAPDASVDAIQAALTDAVSGKVWTPIEAANQRLEASTGIAIGQVHGGGVSVGDPSVVGSGGQGW